MAFLFVLDRLCFFWVIFLTSISGRPLLLFHLAKPQMVSFLEPNFGFEFGDKLVFFGVCVVIIPAWLVLEIAGCEQSELSLCCGSTSMIAAELWNKSLATGCSMTVYPWVNIARKTAGKFYRRNAKLSMFLLFWFGFTLRTGGLKSGFRDLTLSKFDGFLRHSIPSS